MPQNNPTPTNPYLPPPDPLPNPEPIAPSLDQPDPGVFHHDPAKPKESSQSGTPHPSVPSGQLPNPRLL
jgi:hypothetical protein